MRKSAIWIASLIFSLLLLLTVSEIHARWMAKSRGISIATLPAASLGFDLPAFKGPVVAGSHLLATESLHWEGLATGGALIRLTLIVSDERLCWSTVHMGEVKHHGCVVARAPVP